MRIVVVAIICLFSQIYSFGQNTNYYPYKQYYDNAYNQYPILPKGILEAVAYTNTHNTFITPNGIASCSGMPQVYGVYGLVEDGKGYFNKNLIEISTLSGIDKYTLKSNPEQHILAYAKALALLTDNSYVNNYGLFIKFLSEIPNDGQAINYYARNSFLYGVFTFLNDADKAAKYNFTPYNIDLQAYFGQALYEKLSSKNVNLSHQRTADYGPALWVAAPSCNYSSRNGTNITGLVVHTIQGSYSSAISWFGNCQAQVSAHYILRSSDGQVTQMVEEINKGWHVGSENAYTIGLEHEGFVNDPSWYTTAMYESSADLVKDITQSGYNINPLSTYKDSLLGEINACYQIKGHSHYPNQTHTDPGINWDWQYYYDLINDTVPINRLTACSGNFNDNGGNLSNYFNFEKYWTVIEPTGANQVTIDFTQFSLEADYDFMYILDGDENNGVLLGTYTGTNSPGVVTAYSGKMAILFESDCIINELGWVATWDCQSCANPIVVTVDSLTEPDCFGNLGYIAVTASGGASPYTYLWSDNNTGAVNNSLTAGNYALTVIDNVGCSRVEQYSIASSGSLQVVLQKEDNICFGQAFGVIAVAVSGGSAPYTYQWQHGATGFLQTHLTAGQYIVTITDNSGCTAIESASISQGDELIIGPITTNNITGRITIQSVSGGVPPYNYLWADGQQGSSALNLNAGWHSVTISDNAGCSVDTSIYLDYPTGIEAVNELGFSLYPNPTKGKLTIESTQAANLIFYDLSGKEILNRSVLHGKLEIDLSGLQTGIYFYKVWVDGVLVKTDKLVKVE